MALPPQTSPSPSSLIIIIIIITKGAEKLLLNCSVDKQERLRGTFVPRYLFPGHQGAEKGLTNKENLEGLSCQEDYFPHAQYPSSYHNNLLLYIVMLNNTLKTIIITITKRTTNLLLNCLDDKKMASCKQRYAPQVRWAWWVFCFCSTLGPSDNLKSVLCTSSMLFMYDGADRAPCRLSAVCLLRRFFRLLIRPSPIISIYCIVWHQQRPLRITQ